MKRKPQKDSAGASQPGRNDDGDDQDSAGAYQPGRQDDGDDQDTAFASKEETGLAILSVLQQRHDFLRYKGITDMSHILNSDERGELTKRVRDEYEKSEEQVELQDRDAAKGVAKGMTAIGAQSTGRGRGKAKGSGKGRAGGASQPTGKGSVANFVRQQKRKRWCRHLQRVCGTKQIWEVLAYTGNFDVEYIEQTLQSTNAHDDDETAAPVPGKDRRALRHAKAEAKAAFNEGARLARRRDFMQQDGASQPVEETVKFSKNQLWICLLYTSPSPRD